MFTAVFSFLRSAFHSMSSSTSQTASEASLGTSDFLPLASSHHVEINEYLRLIEANASTAERQAQLAQHIVIKLDHMKDEGNNQHEHVIATVKDYKGNIVRLSIGRSKGQNDASDTRNHKKSPKNSYSSSSSSPPVALASIPNSSQDSIFKPMAAMDVVLNIENKPVPRSRVQTTFCPEPPIPLLRLAIIIATVHDQNSLYTVLRSQCYWFAMLIMGVSMAQGGQITSFAEKPLKSKTTKQNPQPEVKYLKPLDLSDPNVDPSEWTQIPILPTPLEMPYETVGNLGPNIGKHNSIPVVAVCSDEIRTVAMKSQRRYKDQLNRVSISALVSMLLLELNMVFLVSSCC
jgi:hypothetical protein